MAEYFTLVYSYRGDCVATKVFILDNLDLPNIKKWVNAHAISGCVDIINDMEYVTRGAAPHLTGNLENSITQKVKKSKTKFSGEIYISAYSNKGFDYGAFRHDFPFNLGEGSLNKPSVVSNITGRSSDVGHLFAEQPLTDNADRYLDFLEESIYKGVN